MKLICDNNINIITISSRRNNAIDDTFLNEFDSLMKSCNTSLPLLIKGSNGYFCPGIDLLYTLKMSIDEMTNYIIKFDKMLVSVLSYPSATFTYINGYAIAGGFALALASDYRIASNGDYYVGYNRDRIGIDLPPVARLIYNRYSDTKQKISGLYKIKEFMSTSIIDYKNSKEILEIDEIKTKNKRFKPFVSIDIAQELSERQEFINSWFRDDVVTYRKDITKKMLESKLNN